MILVHSHMSRCSLQTAGVCQVCGSRKHNTFCSFRLLDTSFLGWLRKNARRGQEAYFRTSDSVQFRFLYQAF